MSDPNPAPQDVVPSIEGIQSTSPAEGSGLQHRLLDPSLNSLRRGRVDDLYLGTFCAVVSVYAYRARVPCIWLAGAMNQWSGARTCSPPMIGTEVLVWLSNDHKYGIILGPINSPVDNQDKPKGSIAHTDIDHDSKNEIHNPKQWGMLGYLLDSSSGIPRDVMPGDDLTINENGAASALLKFVSIIRGGEGSKIEAFIFDELLRVTGFNYQFHSATKEVNLLNDHGQVTETTEFTHRLTEGEGAGNGADAKEGRETGRWREKRFHGAAGDFDQQFLVRPHISTGSLDEPEKRPDMGLAHDILELNGHRVLRSVTAVGLHKSPQIAVPKKRHEADDPAGDSTATLDPKPKEDFVFQRQQEFPNAGVCQISDYFAWLYNHNLPQRLLDKAKDWDVPDEATCPVVGGGKVTKPGLGGFYREVLQPVDALGGDPNYDDDTQVDKKKVTLGEAFIHTMPDGSIVARSNCGCSIVMANGHVDISASHDIRFFAGGTMVAMAGDDLILKARQAIDITSSESQVRVKAQRDLFLHAEQGGMLLDIAHTGFAFNKDPGEARALPGITIKVPNDGGFTVAAGQATFNLTNRFFVAGQSKGTGPEIETRARSMYHWMEQEGEVSYQMGGAYLLFQGGNMFGSGRLQMDSHVYARGDVYSGGIVAGVLRGPADWSKTPHLSSIMKKSGVFDPKLWTAFQYPYTLEDLKNLHFGFRTVADYATQQGAWMEEFWQRDLKGKLEKWQEAKDVEGEYPYPGKAHFESQASLWIYNERNVDSATGRPRPRNQQSKEGGDFAPKNWNSLTVLPRR